MAKMEDEPGAVVFVCDRQGPALERRQRCLKLAGILHTVETEHRPSGTYYKLRVRERDAVAAHLALQMGGCARSSRLQERSTTMFAALRDVARTFWDEAVLLLGRIRDLFRLPLPRLLTDARTRR